MDLLLLFLLKEEKEEDKDEEVLYLRIETRKRVQTRAGQEERAASRELRLQSRVLFRLCLLRQRPTDRQSTLFIP